MYIAYLRKEYLDKYEEILEVDMIDPLVVYINRKPHEINIYAWTNSKKIMKDFILYRKSEMFDYIEYDMDEEDIKEYSELKIMDTFLDDDIYHIPVTLKESMNVFNMIDEFYLIMYDMIDNYMNTNIFKKKFMKLLDNINYTRYMRISKKLNDGANMSIFDDIVQNELSQFKLFKFMYFDTLKEEVLTLT